MSAISLSPLDLCAAALLVLILAVLTARARLGVGRQLIISSMRMTIQLLLIGLVLRALFAHVQISWVALMATVMLLVAGREVVARQHRRFRGLWAFGVGTTSMFISSFTVTILTLAVIVRPDPWFTPQYAIPLLGMLLGNTMNGISLSVDRLTQSAWQQRSVIEQRLILGQSRQEAMADICRDSMRTALTPIINAMAASGIVTLPGMMTGQILAGSPPAEAVKYQILIMFMISSGVGFGSMGAIWLASRRLFDQRDRLRLERLQAPKR
ncbi:MAG: iron export ABC transporter permease subunit FetB [Candidatus Eisenbacteria sp.]|nr:iron export ABC transporter permease subunit FetB [Candidatus Eisenbacteria bacterium]